MKTVLRYRQPNLGRPLIIGAVILSAVSVPACQEPTWRGTMSILPERRHTDYSSAEEHAARTERTLLIFFRETQPLRSDPTEELLDATEFKAKTDGFVRCVLQRSFEPDRRYVRQFGVERAPAVIVVHPDGTYHSLVQEVNAENLRRFLDDARPPGAVPVVDRLLPRPVVYSWRSNVDEAWTEAQKSLRPMFVVLDRGWSRDWERLAPMLQRHEVFSRARHMVHCRPGSIWNLGQPSPRRFDVRNLPAIVVVHPDGRLHRLELPNSSEAIVRFLDQTARSAAAPAGAFLSPYAPSVSDGIGPSGS